MVTQATHSRIAPRPLITDTSSAGASRGRSIRASVGQRALYTLAACKAIMMTEQLGVNNVAKIVLFYVSKFY